MEKGKLIVIEGTDCSGKETQSKLLIERLNNEGLKTEYFSFPKYDTPSGRIVGLSYLGKPYLAEELIMEYIDEVKSKINFSDRGINEQELINLVVREVINSISKGWFKEGAPAVDPKVSCLYYAADRRYNMPIINEKLENGINIILDRYTYSNMAHQGGKISDIEERKAIYEWIAKMEFEMMGLPQSDIRLFLHMPTDYAAFLRKSRSEALDEHERDENHLFNAERAYIEVASMFDFETIKCINENSKIPRREDIKTPSAISEEVYNLVKRKIDFK